jgi:hypothetical protein
VEPFTIGFDDFGDGFEAQVLAAVVEVRDFDLAGRAVDCSAGFEAGGLAQGKDCQRSCGDGSACQKGTASGSSGTDVSG